MGLISFWHLLKNELRLSARSKGIFLYPSLFLLLATSLFPLALGDQLKELPLVGGAILWVLILFSSTLALKDLFQEDFSDGTLDAMVLAPWALEWLFLAKLLSHWIFAFAPILLILPVLALWLGLDIDQAKRCSLALLCGSPALVATGSITAALTIGTRANFFLVPLILLPINISTLIVATLSLTSIAPITPILVLCIFSLVSLPIACLSCKFILKFHIS